MMAPGCTVTSRSSAPCARMCSHAASSAIVLERVYGVRCGLSGSVQSASVSFRSGETGASRHQDRLLAIHHPLPSLACPPPAGTWQDRTGIPSTAQIRPVPRPPRASSAQTTRLARRRQHRAAPRSQGRMAAPQAPAALGCCTMRQRTLGGTGVHVTPICLGAMMFGAWGETDHDAAIRIVHRALEAGVNFIDTADVYSRGESEEIVGKALSDGRR